MMVSDIKHKSRAIRELGELGARFVCWRYEQRGGKSTKVPRRADGGGRASTSDPSSWATLERCRSYAREQKLIDGYGPVLGDLGDGRWLVGVDLDNCIDEIGDLKPWARDIVESVRTYTELSPSRTGIKLFGVANGELPFTSRRQVVRRAPDELHHEQVELYTRGRFFTLTGERFPGTPDELCDVTAALATLATEMGAEGVSTEARERQPIEPVSEAQVEEVIGLLDRVPIDALDYTDWIRHIAAAKNAGGGDPRVLDKLIAWAGASELYDNPPELVEQKWESVRDATAGIGTLQAWPPPPKDAFDVVEDEGDEAPAAPSKARSEWPEPVDLWDQFAPPPLPEGVLPAVIEDFARQHGKIMGADPAAIAMSALAVCSAALTDDVKLQVKPNEPFFTVSARLWVALIGDPSTKKSPAMRAAAAPLKAINAKLCRDYQFRKEAYDELDKEQKKSTTPPVRKRKILEDITIEAAQPFFADNPEGLLVLQDELSGWFGSMDKYSGGGRGAQKDRAFWLQAFEGGSYSVDRIMRGSSFIPNLSASVLGGIQPEPLRKIVGDAVDDGLIQRLFPVVLAPSRPDSDDPLPAGVQDRYDALVDALDARKGAKLRFDAGAQRLRRQLADEHHALLAVASINPKLAAHIGKLDGLYGRLCVLWHAIEHAGQAELPETICEATAGRVAAFLRRFLRPHAVAFYASLGLSDDHSELQAVASHILAKKLETISLRNLSRATRRLKSLTRHDASRVLEQLTSLGWLEPAPGSRHDSTVFTVNPLVHARYQERGHAEGRRRQEAYAAMRALSGGEHAGE